MGEDQQPAAQRDKPQSRWGDPISDACKTELQAILDTWDAPDADRGDRKGRFDRVSLTGAGVFWLAEQVRDSDGWVLDLRLEGANLDRAQR